jgi:nicotinamide riboside kinase
MGGAQGGFVTLRISVSGAFSTGKSTLIDAAARRLREVGHKPAVIAEVARGVLAAGYLLDREATIESYLFYVRQQLAADRACSDAGLLLSDRTLIDLLAYVVVNDDPAIPREFVDLLAEIVRYETEFYDLYCYLPVEFAPAADGEREVDPAYQQVVSRRLRELIDEFGVSVVELRGTVTERVETLLEVIGMKGLA